VTRKIDLEHRSAVLDRISAYVVRRGLIRLSLRPLAKAVGLSPRTLLYHFGSKEAIVAAVIDRIRQRQQAMFEQLRRSEVSTPGAICRAAWTSMTAPQVMPMLRLFFETYALALRTPKRFTGFLERAVEDWLEFLAAPMLAQGAEPERARTIATVVLAGYRGFMLDFVATGDRTRIGSAVDAWVDSLESLMPEKGDDRAQPA
jgi:AcrR family transcriptional regulator